LQAQQLNEPFSEADKRILCFAAAAMLFSVRVYASLLADDARRCVPAQQGEVKLQLQVRAQFEVNRRELQHSRLLAC
jgi:hypothetical protein